MVVLYGGNHSLGHVKLITSSSSTQKCVGDAGDNYYLLFSNLTVLQVQISRVGACYYLLLTKKHIRVTETLFSAMICIKSIETLIWICELFMV